MTKTIIALLLVSLLSPVFAAKAPSQGRVDPRIKNVIYNESDVYVIHGHYGYSTHIIFAEDEVIQHVSPGDSIAWQFNPKKNHLFMQPVEDDADTNLSVLTNKRMYNFELRSGEAANVSDPSLTFLVQFHYPEDKLQRQILEQQLVEKEEKVTVKAGLDPETLNFNYSMRGDESIAPNKVFDDGVFTYFQFDENIKTRLFFQLMRVILKLSSITMSKGNISLSKALPHNLCCERIHKQRVFTMKKNASLQALKVL